jgi:purine-binding chemotaxis protein CheW
VEETAKQYVVFRVGSEEYGVPIEHVASIIRYTDPTPIPRAPDDVMGVINLRGMVVPVVDLRKRFAGPAEGSEQAPFERIVVTESEIGSVGLAVDAASEVAAIPLESIREAPETTLSSHTAEAFEGVASLEDRLIILLRLEKAIPHERYATLSVAEGEDDA